MPIRADARRHEGADLRQDRDQRVLPQKRALAGHVGAGDEPDAVLAEHAIVGDKRRPCPAQRRLDASDAARRGSRRRRRHRSPAAPSRLRRRSSAMRGGDVEHGERRRGGGDLGAARHDLADEIVEQPQFERQRALGGAGDPAFEFGQLDRRVALRAGHRLAVDEIGAELAGIAFGRHLDVIADHVVVADAQRGDRRSPRHSAPATRRSARRLSSRNSRSWSSSGEIARRDEAAVAGEQRQFGGQRAAEPLDQDAVLAEPAARPRPARSGSGTSPGAGEHRRAAPRSRRARRASAARSRGPPRPRLSRVSARSISGNAPQPLAQRRAQRRGDRQRTAPRRAARRSRSGVGQRRREMLGQQARARPGQRCGRSSASRLPRRSPDRVAVSSRLRRVAASICMTESGATRRGGARCSAPPASPWLLGQRDVIDQRAGGGDLGPAELAEPVERLDAVELLRAGGAPPRCRSAGWRAGSAPPSSRRTARTAPGAPAAARAPGSRPA